MNKSAPISANMAVAFIFLVFYTPILRNITGSSSASQFVLNMFILFSGIFVLLLNNQLNFNFNRLSVVFLSLAYLVLLVSLIYDSSLNRLLSDVGRLILSGAYCWLGYRFASSEMILEEKLNRCILIYAGVGIIFSSFVFFDFLHPIVDLYKGRLSDDEISFHFLRASGFAGYPTDFGCFLVLAGLLAFRLYNQGFVSSKFIFYFNSLIAIGLFFSAARGAVIQVLGLVFLSILFGFRYLTRAIRRNLYLTIFSFSILFSIFLYLFFLTSFLAKEDEFSNISYIFSIIDGGDDSILHRFNELDYGLRVLIGELQIPYGSARDEPFGLDVIEGAWGHYLIRYGIFGILLYMTFNIYLLFVLRRCRSGVLGWAVYYWYLTFVIFVAPFSDVTSRLRGLSIYFLLIGFVMGFRKLYIASKYICIDPVKSCSGVIVDFPDR